MPANSPKIHAGFYTSIFLLVYTSIHVIILRQGFQLRGWMTIYDVVTFLLGIGLIVFILNYRKFKQIHTIRNILWLIFQNLILSALCIYFLEWLTFQIWDDEVNYIIFYQQSVFARILILWIVVCNVSIIQLFSISAAQQAADQERAMYNEQLVRDAELFKLRQQINPHFLFNSLNSINALIGMDSNRARSMIQQLSAYFRNNINKDEYKWITLAEELKDIGLYFDIEKVRFGHRLNLVQEIDDSILQSEIPPLLMQPLVENAIKYGLYGTTGNIDIKLRVKKITEGPQLFISFCIENPYDPSYKQVAGTGFGLNAIHRRLYLLFSRNDLLQTTSYPSNAQDDLAIYSAKIKIPISSLTLKDN